MDLLQLVRSEFSWRKAQLTEARKRVRFNKTARDIYRRHEFSDHDPITGRNPSFAAIVCLIRGEDDYLLEWIEFHRLMGIEHYIIYDNAVTDASALTTRRLLQPYIEEEVVTYIRWPDLPGLRDRWDDTETLSLQQLAYGDCVRRFRRFFQWLIKIDVDEFLFRNSERYETVAEVLNALNERMVMGLRLRRKEFGSSGHQKRPEGLVIENYHQCARGLGSDTKAIGNSDFLANDLFSNAFNFHYAFGPKLTGKFLGHPKELRMDEAERMLRLNHYNLKSLEEYSGRFNLNAQGYMAGKENPDRFASLDRQYSDISDKKIMKYVAALRQRLLIREHCADAGK